MLQRQHVHAAKRNDAVYPHATLLSFYYAAANMRKPMQAFILYEDELTDSKAQVRALTSMAGTLLSCQGFDPPDYDALATKTAQYAAKLLKKPDQCRMVTLCSHLFWSPDEVGFVPFSLFGRVSLAHQHFRVTREQFSGCPPPRRHPPTYPCPCHGAARKYLLAFCHAPEWFVQLNICLTRSQVEKIRRIAKHKELCPQSIRRTGTFDTNTCSVRWELIDGSKRVHAERAPCFLRHCVA